jgi:hypothetical protein
VAIEKRISTQNFEAGFAADLETSWINEQASSFVPIIFDTTVNYKDSTAWLGHLPNDEPQLHGQLSKSCESCGTTSSELTYPPQ